LALEDSPEVPSAVTPDYKQYQREAKLAPKRRFAPALVEDKGRKFLRSASGDIYARNFRGDLIKVSKRLTGRAARWRRRILSRAENAIAAMKQAEQLAA
jgi:hypothetical protein